MFKEIFFHAGPFPFLSVFVAVGACVAVLAVNPRTVQALGIVSGRVLHPDSHRLWRLCLSVE
jgi:hypothetical protein